MKSNDPFISVNPGRKQRRRHRQVCSEPGCQNTNPKPWRLGPNGEPLCNRCGLRKGRKIRNAGVNATFRRVSPTSIGVCPYSPSAAMRVCDTVDNDFSSEPDNHERRPSISSSLGGNSEGRDVFHESDYDEMSVRSMENSRAHACPDAQWRLRQLDTNIIGLDVSPSVDNRSPDICTARVVHVDPSLYLSPTLVPCDGYSPVSPVDITSAPVQADQNVTDSDCAAANAMLGGASHFGSAQPQGVQPDEMGVFLQSLMSETQMYSDQAPSPVFGTSQLDSYFSNSTGMFRSYIDDRTAADGGTVAVTYVQVSGNDAPYNPVIEYLGSQVAEPVPCSDTDERGSNEIPSCKCSLCLRKFFAMSDATVPSDPGPDSFARCFRAFYSRAASVHLGALGRGSSVYVATETFIYDQAGEPVMTTTYAILREVYDLAASPCHLSQSTTAFEAARCDLEFGFVIGGVVADPTLLDDWLYEQLLIKHVQAERSKSAIWDLSRLPTGSHLSDSETFRWLKRNLRYVDTRSGRQVVFQVQSGNDDYQFRRFHRVQAIIKFIKTPSARRDMFGYLEPYMIDASIKSCQEWWIAVLDEAAKRGSWESQLRFVEVNKAYMWESMTLHRDAFEKMNIMQPRHVCGPCCSSHIQPTFDTVMKTAKDALDKLVSFATDMPFTYPTQEQMFWCRIVGQATFKLYFTYALLNSDQRACHSELTRERLVKARVSLAEQSKAKLIWNYLPVDVSRAASAKLDRILEAFSSSSSAYEYESL